MSFEFKGAGFGQKGQGFGKQTGGFSPGAEDNPLENTKYTGYLDEDLGEELSELQKGSRNVPKRNETDSKKPPIPNFGLQSISSHAKKKTTF